MKIVNEAQIKHEYYFIKQNMKIHFFFYPKKNKLLGICMIYPILTIHIHIPNIKESIKGICMEARDSRVYMYIY